MDYLRIVNKDVICELVGRLTDLNDIDNFLKNYPEFTNKIYECVKEIRSGDTIVDNKNTLRFFNISDLTPFKNLRRCDLPIVLANINKPVNDRKLKFAEDFDKVLNIPNLERFKLLYNVTPNLDYAVTESNSTDEDVLNINDILYKLVKDEIRTTFKKFVSSKKDQIRLILYANYNNVIYQHFIEIEGNTFRTDFILFNDENLNDLPYNLNFVGEPYMLYDYNKSLNSINYVMNDVSVKANYVDFLWTLTYNNGNLKKIFWRTIFNENIDYNSFLDILSENYEHIVYDRKILLEILELPFPIGKATLKNITSTLLRDYIDRIPLKFPNVIHFYFCALYPEDIGSINLTEISKKLKGKKFTIYVPNNTFEKYPELKSSPYFSQFPETKNIDVRTTLDFRYGDLIVQNKNVNNK